MGELSPEKLNEEKLNEKETGMKKRLNRARRASSGEP